MSTPRTQPTAPFAPGERVRITQPKWPEHRENTETTTHYGVVVGGCVQPHERASLVGVKIDSGATIIYPTRHVFRVDEPEVTGPAADAPVGSYFRGPYGMQRRLGTDGLARMQRLYDELCETHREDNATDELIAASRVLKAHGIDPEGPTPAGNDDARVTVEAVCDAWTVVVERRGESHDLGGGWQNWTLEQAEEQAKAERARLARDGWDVVA
jgi:hypothetical protein